MFCAMSEYSDPAVSEAAAASVTPLPLDCALWSCCCLRLHRVPNMTMTIFHRGCRLWHSQPENMYSKMVLTVIVRKLKLREMYKGTLRGFSALQPSVTVQHAPR